MLATCACAGVPCREKSGTMGGALHACAGRLGRRAASRCAHHVWMSEEAMRKAFIGKTLDGHYVDGLRWTETYGAEGRLDYRESARKGLGHWYFRGHVFCTFYDPGYGLNGGCWTRHQGQRQLLRILHCRPQRRPHRGRSRAGSAGELGGARLAQGRALDLRGQAQRVSIACTIAPIASVALYPLAHMAPSVVIPAAPFPL